MDFNSSLTLLTPCLNPNLNQFRKLFNSISNQKVFPDKWIIIDGGSSEEISSTISNQVRNINHGLNVTILNRPGSSIYSAINIGIKFCETKYYMVIGCDDFLINDSINYIKSNIEISDDIVVCSVIKSNNLCIAKKNRSKFISFNGSTKIITNHSGGTIIKKSIHKEMGSYDERYIILADTKFIIDCYLKKYKFKYLKEIASEIGVYGISKKKNRLAYLELFRILEEFNFNRFINLLFLNLRLIIHR